MSDNRGFIYLSITSLISLRRQHRTLCVTLYSSVALYLPLLASLFVPFLPFHLSYFLFFSQSPTFSLSVLATLHIMRKFQVFDSLLMQLSHAEASEDNQALDW